MLGSGFLVDPRNARNLWFGIPQNSVDTFSPIQVQKAFHSWNRGKLISGAGSELVSLRLERFQLQPILSNEKEICVAICVLQTPGFIRRAALFRGSDDCAVGARQSLCATTDTGSSNQSAMGRIQCGEQNRAVGNGSHCQRTAG